MTECEHNELYFGSGGYYVFCRGCFASWVALRKGHVNDAEIDVTAGTRAPGKDYQAGTFVWTPKMNPGAKSS